MPEHDRAFQLLEIDKFRLDEEVAKQPQLFREHADILARCEREAAEAKANLELVKAEAKARFEGEEAKINLDIRADPQSYGLDKGREKEIEAAIITQDGYRKAHARMLNTIREAQQKCIETDEKESVAKGVVESYRQRKSMIEKAVELLLSDYWAAPKQPREYKDAKADKAFNRRKE
jgi:hypothetical protein